MYEKRLKAVPPQLFTVDGTVTGKVTVTNTKLFKVKQKIILAATSLPDLELEVKRVDSINIMYVGPDTGNIDSRADVSAYTVALSANIFANEQKRSSVPEQEIERLTYEEEPTVARRVSIVDPLGDKIDSVTDSNGVKRLAVDGMFTAAVDVQVDVDIDGYYDATTNPDPDNVGLIGHTRSNPTDEPQQRERITAKRGTVDNTNVSMDVSLHDQFGNGYTTLNPLPATGSFEKFFELITSSKWMELASYDQVIPTYSDGDTTLTLAFKEDGALLGEAVITNFTSLLGWDIKLNRYIDEDDGSPLQDDDDTFLNLD